LFGLAPLFLFELRHSFSQTHAFFGSLQSDQRDVYTGWLKVEHTLSLTFKNIANLFHGGIVQIPFFWSFLFLFICFLFLVIHRKVSTFTVVLFSLSVILTVGFFAQYSKILSEYYLNGIQFVWFSIFVLTVSALLSKKIFQNVGIVFIILFSFLNVIRFVQYPVNASGYTQRRAIISEIKEDMALHNYPCFSISYITSPGNNLGYRYLFYLEDMHVNNPSSGSPVYTIVFPHSMVDHIDKAFGALGLIYPDYTKYALTAVTESCSGENSNITDPLFGYIP
jgi:hypothetical protein